MAKRNAPLIALLAALLAALALLVGCGAKMKSQKADSVGGIASPSKADSAKKTTSASGKAPDARSGESEHLEKAKDLRIDADVPPERSAEDRPLSPAPSPGVDRIVKSDDSGFEGDTFDEDARGDIDELVESIEDGLDGYREEFGVEGLTSTSPDSCEEVCDLSEAICKSSRRICAISGSHPRETYFADRCQWSTKHCANANEQCNTCNH